MRTPKAPRYERYGPPPKRRPDTRERIVDASAELMRLQGYNATGIKQIIAAAQAPFGSIYHHFPGGKEQLGAEAIQASGTSYEQLIPAVFDPAPDLPSAVRMFFAGAAEHLAETGYADACPIATVALEVSSSSEPMRMACADVFESWIAAGLPRFTDAGLTGRHRTRAGDRDDLRAGGRVRAGARIAQHRTATGRRRADGDRRRTRVGRVAHGRF